MLGDRERSGAYASEQRRLVRAAVAAEVLTYASYWREAAAEAGLRRPSSVKDLAALPPRPLTALGPPNTLVMRPPPEAVRKSGPRPLRRRLRRARVRRGSAGAMQRILDPLYKAIHWIIEGDVPVGCTEADLVRLAELGRRSLEVAGIGQGDAIVGLVPPGPTLSSWQLVLGAREAAVPLAALAPSASIEAVTLLGPTVLAGRPPDLLRVLDGLSGSARRAISTLLTITRAPLLPAERAALEAAAGPEAVVVESWAPLGTRALWTQCRGGEGVHTWPQAELLEVCTPAGDAVEPGAAGELVWTGLGWRGTAMVRLATGVRGRLVEGPCETCGRTTPRVLDARPISGVKRPVGDGDAMVSETTETGADESVRTVRPRRSTPRRGGRRSERQPAAATAAPAVEAPLVDAEDEGVRLVSADTAAGVIARPEKVGRRSRRDGNGDAAANEVARARDVDVDAVRAAATDEAEDDRAVRAGPKEDTEDEVQDEGVVRAVAREAADLVPPAPAPWRPATAEPDEVDLGHLPPVPEVGPDASGDRSEEAWLPDTGEVDAWPAPVLASTEGLAAWQVEHRRRRGRDELVVHLALADGGELAEVLVALERAIGATQYVVAAEADIAARVAAAGGRRVVDRRSSGNGHGRPSQPSAAGAPGRSWKY